MVCGKIIPIRLHCLTCLLEQRGTPMKSVACLLSTLTIAAASFALCSPSFADPPQTLNLTIENHQKLVTVKDSNGTWVFAQVISTPNLEVSQVSLGKYLSRISLQDGTGKTLWSKIVDCAVSNGSPHGEWSDKFVSTLSQSSKSLGWTYSDTGPNLNVKRFVFVIGSDDQLVTLRVGCVKHNYELTPIKNGFVARMDGSKTVIVLQPPAAPAVAQASTP